MEIDYSIISVDTIKKIISIKGQIFDVETEVPLGCVLISINNGNILETKVFNRYQADNNGKFDISINFTEAINMTFSFLGYISIKYDLKDFLKKIKTCP